MMFIKKQQNGINLQSDTEHFDNAYISILSKLEIFFPFYYSYNFVDTYNMF